MWSQSIVSACAAYSGSGNVQLGSLGERRLRAKAFAALWTRRGGTLLLHVVADRPIPDLQSLFHGIHLIRPARQVPKKVSTSQETAQTRAPTKRQILVLDSIAA